LPHALVPHPEETLVQLAVRIFCGKPLSKIRARYIPVLERIGKQKILLKKKTLPLMRKTIKGVEYYKM
jgi:hypothetical protein